MQQIGLPARRAANAGDEASRLTRLHALALPAARDRDGLPVSFDRDADRVIPERVVEFTPSGGGRRMLRRPLTLGERGALEARAAALELALMPFTERDEDRVRAAIAAMLGGFRSMRQQDEDVAAVVDVTAAVLREFPAWAIERACLKIARHESGLDRRFAPHDGEVADAVREVLRPYREAHDQATGILSGSGEAPKPALSRAHHPSYAELQERCARDGLLIGERGHDSVKAAEEFRAKHGISKEAFDAIPDAPGRTP